MRNPIQLLLHYVRQALFFVVLPLALALAVYFYLYNIFLKPVDLSSTQSILIEIPAGQTSFRETFQALQDKGVIRSARGLNLLARIRGDDKRIKAGEYDLSPALAPREILNKFVSGDVVKRVVLVKEGASAFEVGAVIEAAGLASRAEFEHGVVDPVLLARAGIPSQSFEGYLFPETYYFSKPLTVKDIIWRMMEEGERRWKQEFSDRAAELSMTRHEILTLASIIQKESGKVDEQPIISSVFHNRLKEDMKLQSDPTVIYGIPNFDGNLTRAQLETPTPYNTYVNFGLPPGPIGNPGDSAIVAALYPATTSYLFFVADGTGKHVFSTTLDEHNTAVQKYQIRHESPSAP